MSEPAEPAKRPKLLWYATAPAPYRFPVWEELGRRFDLTVITCETLPPERQWAVPEAEHFKLVSADLRGVGRGALRFYRGEAPDLIDAETSAVIIMGWASPALRRVQRIALSRNVPVFTFYESTRQSQYFAFGPIDRIRKSRLQASDGVLVPGPAAGEAVLASGVSAERTTVVGNTIDAPRYLAIATRRNRDRRDGHTYTYVGQPIRRKNVPELIRAFDAVARPNDMLYLAGFTEPSRAIARALARRRNGNAEVVGFVEGSVYDDLLARTDTLVLPSTREVWGMVAQEALLAGCHVVVSEQCGVSQSLAGEPGVWVSGTSRASIAVALRESAAAWQGPLKPTQPEFSRASYFADQTAEAITVARSRQNR